MSWYWLIICTISGAVLGFLCTLQELKDMFIGEGDLDGEDASDLSRVILGAIMGIYFYFFYYLLYFFFY